MGSALIIVDVQNDFTPGGALAAPEGDRVIPRVNELAGSGAFDIVVATRDAHPPDHGSFHDQGGPWPTHCVAGTPGFELHPDVDRANIDAIVDKGTTPDREGYSGFEDTELARLLREKDVDAVTVVGLTTEYCVRATALEALERGLAVTIDSAAVRAVDPAAAGAALDELRAAGADVD